MNIHKPHMLGLILALAVAHVSAAPAQNSDLSSVPATAPAFVETTPAPAAQANAALDGLGDNLDDKAAQERMLELMQQGKYVRKSLLITPTLFWIGDGQGEARDNNRIVTALRDSLKHMARFDINTVPDQAFAGMRSAWQAQGTQGAGAQRELALSSLVETTLGPALLGSMMGPLKERAERNLTEAESNSFMVDKAKESGISAVEMNLVLNSGFIVVPVLQFSVSTASDKLRVVMMKGGLVLYQVKVSRDRIWLEKRATLIRNGQAMTGRDGYSIMERAMMPADQRLLPTQELMVRRSMDEMIGAVMQDLRDLNDFRLLAQITSGEGSTFQAPFMPSEIKDVTQDKFFEQVEQVQGKDGAVTEEVTGWGFVRTPINFKTPVKILDTNITEYIWEGYLPSGKAQAFSNLREYSRIFADMDFRGGVGTVSLTVPASTNQIFKTASKTPGEEFTVGGNGLFLQNSLLFGPIGFSQLHFRLNTTYKLYSLDSGALSAKYYGNNMINFTGMATYDVGLGLEKKWWIGRFVPNLGADVRFGEMGIYGEYGSGIFTSTLDLYDYYIGARATAGLEFAFTPNVRLGVSAAGLWNAGFGSWSTKDSEGNTDATYTSALESDTPSITPTGIEMGAYLMVNLWPLQKLKDVIMSGMTSAIASGTSVATH